jgi:hypothetical protein
VPVLKRALLSRTQSDSFRTTASRQWTSMFHAALGVGSCARSITSCRRGRGASSCSVMEFIQKTLNSVCSSPLLLLLFTDGRTAVSLPPETCKRQHARALSSNGQSSLPRFRACIAAIAPQTDFAIAIKPKLITSSSYLAARRPSPLGDGPQIYDGIGKTSAPPASKVRQRQPCL